MSIVKTFGFSQGLGINAGTTSGTDTTGSSLIVISVRYINTVTLSSDSAGNSWSSLTERTGDYVRGRLFYCLNPNTSGTHTITFSGSSSYCAVSVMGFSGVGSYDSQESGAGGVSVATLQPGSLTPSGDNALLVTGSSVDGDDATVESINSSFAVDTQVQGVAGSYGRSAIAYLIQSTAAAVNPQWSGATKRRTAQMAVFLPAASVSGSPHNYYAQCV